MCHTDVFYVNESTKVNEPVAHAPVLSTAPVPPASDEPGSGVPFAATIYKQHCPKSDLKARRVGHEDASNLANNSHRTGARQLHLVQIQPIRLQTRAQHEVDVGSALSPGTHKEHLPFWRIRAPCDSHVDCDVKPRLPLHVHALLPSGGATKMRRRTAPWTMSRAPLMPGKQVIIDQLGLVQKQFISSGK